MTLTSELPATNGQMPTVLPETSEGLEQSIDQAIVATLPLSLQIYFNNALYDRCKQIAGVMARAEGFTPRHLLNKTEACFAVVTTSLRTQIDPFFLASKTFQTPGGQVGYMTQAVQAIIDQSGILSRVPQREYYGDWTKVTGKFEVKRGSNGSGKEYAQPTWTRQDAEGLGLKITLHFKDQDQPEEFSMDLIQAFPLFSTMWATDPKTQMFNLVCRRAITSLRPGALAGVREQEEILQDEAADEAREMKDVTPKVERTGDAGLDAFADEEQQAAETVVDEVGTEGSEADQQADKTTEKAAKKKPAALKAVWLSPDDPEHPVTSVAHAVSVLRNGIEEAKTPALAKTIFDQNMSFISQLSSKVSDELEAALSRRTDKRDDQLV